MILAHVTHIERKSCVLIRLCALIRLGADHNTQWKGFLECFRRVDAVSMRPVEATGTWLMLAVLAILFEKPRHSSHLIQGRTKHPRAYVNISSPTLHVFIQTSGCRLQICLVFSLYEVVALRPARWDLSRVEDSFLASVRCIKSTSLQFIAHLEGSDDCYKYQIVMVQFHDIYTHNIKNRRQGLHLSS